MNSTDRRFGGVTRLYGSAALQRFHNAHVLVVGLGGVGSWSVEALARSGVGRLTLVDLDEVCVSNINRQLPAMDSTLGLSKAEVLADRVRNINPMCRVEAVQDFFTEQTACRLLDIPEEQEQTEPLPSLSFLSLETHPSSTASTQPHTHTHTHTQSQSLPQFISGGGDRPHIVIDAIDHVRNKVLLIVLCRKYKIPCVVCGAAGGRTDPSQVRVADLTQVSHDRLLREVRKQLRRQARSDFSAKRWDVPCVYSTQPAGQPHLPEDACKNAAGSSDQPVRRLHCELGYGSSVMVTGTFGFMAAAHALDLLHPRPHPPNS